MRYETINDLPQTLRDLLSNREAQETYLKTYNETWDTYDKEKETGQQSRDAEAHRDGWAAVQREFIHDEERGLWYRQGQEPRKENRDGGLIDKIKHLIM